MMLKHLRRLVPLALLACLACQPKAAAPDYGPWEEGLTLDFENPTLPQPLRSEQRLQLRVTRSPLAPGPPHLIQLDLASTKGRVTVLVNHHEGGIDLVDEHGRVLGMILPPHFPEIQSWTDRGIDYQIVGRGAWEGASLLPPTSNPVGVWVEARSPQGPRRRVLYLPNLGGVEAREERGGAWVVVNRLVARGFTDLPSLKRPQ